MANEDLVTAATGKRGGLFPVLLQASSLLLGFMVLKFLYGGYQWRMKFRALRDMNIPIIPHSFIWGHLIILGQFAASFPADISGNMLSIWLVTNWKTLFPDQKRCPDVIYMDVWPVGRPMIFTLHPKLSAQYTQTRSLPKDVTEKDFLRPLTQNKDIVSADGELWKQWRARFNPGFSPRNIVALMPAVMEDVMVFLDVLASLAGEDGGLGEVVQLERLTTNLTFDIIGKAMLDLRLNEQRSEKGSALKTALTDQARRIGTRFSIKRFIAEVNPWSRLAHNNRVMEDFLLPHVTQQLSSSIDTSTKETRTIMDFVVASLRNEAVDKDAGPLEPDQEFMDTLIANLKTFLFAGHDTTATTICWAFKCLEENPDCLAKLRQEHDQCLGPNPDEAHERILNSPHVLNSMLYTTGCVKETLRLYTPAATMRAGQPNFFLSDPESQLQYPTEGYGIGDGNAGIHRHPDVWPRPSEFVPERWLAKEGDPLFPMKDAWRPFEQGPRNCVGQELAMMELKLVLVLVVRKFDIEQAWERWDELRGHTGPKDEVAGKRLYMIGDGTGHTKDETPVRIRQRRVTVV
ncbi:vera protein [Xylariales sp. AK1849]|nr:vera protein [Xylariales sp. AK1849]